MKKKLVVVCVSLMMTMSLAACGSRTVKVGEGAEEEQKESVTKKQKKESSEEETTKKKKSSKEQTTEEEKTKKSKKKEEPDGKVIGQGGSGDGERISRVNYYDKDGKLSYFETYAYYDDGLLCSTTMHSVEWYGQSDSYSTGIYTYLYEYDEEGNITGSFLDSVASVDSYDSNSGKIIIGYRDVDGTGNYEELSIYPDQETIESERFGVDSSLTSEVYDEAVVIPKKNSKKWAAAYTEKLESAIETDMTECTLLFVNEDDAPELNIDYGYGYAGAEVLTCQDGQVDALAYHHGYITCKERSNLIYICEGHMGVNADTFYRIQKGKFQKVAGGEYHEKEMSANDTEFSYEYSWEGEPVSAEKYQEHIMDLSQDTSINDMEQNMYSLRQCIELMKYLSE